MKRLIGLIVIVVLMILYFDVNDNELLYRVKALSFGDYEYFDDNGNEVIVLDNLGQVEDVINMLSVDVLYSAHCSDRLIIEGYTNKISKYTSLNGFKVNIQMSISRDSIILGSPLIKGSFWFEIVCINWNILSIIT